MSALMVVVGLPGAGKTSAGRRAARRLNVPFADSDSLIEARAEATISDLFAVRGEAAFRALEADVITEALSSFDGVLALGGGAVTTPEVRNALRESGVTVVHMVTTVASALARVGDGSSRPLLRGDPAGRLAVLEQQRTPLYEAVSTAQVRSGGRPISMIVDDLVAVGESVLAARSAS
jgi:shikimate kinase